MIYLGHLVQSYPESQKILTFQGSTNCKHGEDLACNMHTKRFLRARNYVHASQSKHIPVVSGVLFKCSSI